MKRKKNSSFTKKQHLIASGLLGSTTGFYLGANRYVTRPNYRVRKTLAGTALGTAGTYLALRKAQGKKGYKNNRVYDNTGLLLATGLGGSMGSFIGGLVAKRKGALIGGALGSGVYGGVVYRDQKRNKNTSRYRRK